MFLKWLWLFSVFAFNLTVLTVLVYWSLEAAKTLTFLGTHSRNIWTFWLRIVVYFSPIYCLVNYLFYYAYWYGYQKLFPGQMWKVIETSWLASLVVALIVTWLYMGQLPTKNALVALVFLAAALLAILWK